MRTRNEILVELSRKLRAYIDQPFTEHVYDITRRIAAELMDVAYEEGQATMVPFICANITTPLCKLDAENGDAERVCRQCQNDGGFSI
jgi:hypothetical protein